MTEQEQEINRVISYIRSCREVGIDTTITIDKSRSHFVLNALEEIRQYRAIGTVEDCREAREKQRAVRPVTYQGTNRADCPMCGATVRGIDKPFGDWCSKCGQHLDWSI